MTDYATEERVLVFCDAHSFSKLMVELGDRCPAFIQTYYERIGEAVVSRGGQLIKYLGDGIFSSFQKGSEVTAVECAKDMRKQYAGIMEEFHAKTESDLEIGIGKGEVTVGIFGHASLRNVDIFGEKVNEVAIIMHHRGIAVTYDVKTALGDRYTLIRQPDVKPKWSDTVVSIWEVQ